MILEARDRVGGRVENFKLRNGGVTELGAAFVGPTQDHVLALADELGLKVFKEYDYGDNLLSIQGQQSTYSSDGGALPMIDATTGTAIASALGELDTMAAAIDTSSPWSTENATLWDGMTFQSWLDTNVQEDAVRDLFSISSGAIFSATPGELSLLYVLSYVAGAGNETTPGSLQRLVSVTGGSQESRIVGGTGLLATGLAQKIGPDSISLGSGVSSIVRNTDSKYTVTTGKQTVVAKNVIVAMSPPLAARITYDPPLPAARDQLTQRMFMGALGKATAIYDRPFWRDANLTGQVISDSGVVRTTLDVSPGTRPTARSWASSKPTRCASTTPPASRTSSTKSRKTMSGTSAPRPRTLLSGLSSDGIMRFGPAGVPLLLLGQALLASMARRLRRALGDPLGWD